MTTDRDRHIGAAGERTVDSIVGQGTRMSGRVDLNGMLRIDGEFNGEVRARGQVLIGRTGRTESTVHAGTVIVAGVVRGDVVASELVELRSTATMIGTICTPRLIVEEGGRFCGRCSAGGEGDQMADDRPVSSYLTKSA
jgi:cytoskeletal protein CcmA (bactofilin family)